MNRYSGFFFVALISSFTFWSFEVYSQARPITVQAESFELLDPTNVVDISAELRKTDIYTSFVAKIQIAKKRKGVQQGFRNTTGDIETFFVRNIQTLTTWDSVSALCIYDSDKIAFWLSIDSKELIEQEFDLDEVVETLSIALEDESNSDAVNPSIGIFERNLKFFGNPPDIDGDGVLDILLLDIQDNFENTGSFVAGFFDPVDIIEHPNSNSRDLIYIDVFPSLIHDGEINYSRVLAIIAHEFQHLIHANYEGDEPQNIFINEGLSELAEVLSGYWTRNAFDYFRSSDRSLLSWNYQDPIPDYTRASLFFTYLFEQIGFEKTLDLVSTKEIGIDALEELVQNHHSLSFHELFRNWGKALMINNTNNDPRFGYMHPFFSEVKVIEAEIGQFPFGITKEASPYSNHFYYFPLTSELHVRLNESNLGVSSLGILPTGEHLELSDNVTWIDISQTKHTSALINIYQLENASEVPIAITGSSDATIFELKYDDGIPDRFIGNSSYLLIDDAETKLAFSFPIQQTAWVSDFSLKTIFKSELSGSSISKDQERDILFQLFSVDQGLPDAPITPLMKHTFNRPFGNLRLENISLNSLYDQLSFVEDSIAIVLSNDEDDDNFFAIGLENSEQQLASYTDAENWRQFDQHLVKGVNLSGWTPIVRLGIVVDITNYSIQQSDITATLRNSEVVLNVQADQQIDVEQSSVLALLPSGDVFVTKFTQKNIGTYLNAKFPVEVDGQYQFKVHLTDGDGLNVFQGELDWNIPETADFTLSNNYPNPFNPSTTVPFLLVEDGQVSVQVFDLLGRLVFSTPAEHYLAGQQTINLDFTGYASGVYLIRMIVERPSGRGAVTRTLKVMLLK